MGVRVIGSANRFSCDIAAPSAATADWRVRQGLRGPTGDIQPLEFALGKEPDRAAVWRPQRLGTQQVRVQRAAHRGRDKQPPLGGTCQRDVQDPLDGSHAGEARGYPGACRGEEGQRRRAVDADPARGVRSRHEEAEPDGGDGGGHRQEEQSARGSEALGGLQSAGDGRVETKAAG